MTAPASTTPHTELFNDLLRLAVESKVSDVIVKAGKPGYVRRAGKLEAVEMEPIPSATAEAFVVEHVPAVFRRNWTDEGQVDFAYSAAGVGRFRVNAFHQRGQVSVVLRHIKDSVPTFEQLGLGQTEQALVKLAQAKDGILLVCGATGSGKSSTMAAMLNWINRNLDRHIVTIEDPIEFLHRDLSASITQREVGVDTESAEIGLRAALRQDPDVIVLGDLRDAAAVNLAIKAAETGRVVIAVMPTPTAVAAVGQVLTMLPTEERAIGRMRFADALRGVVAQQLVPRADGKGRIPVVELLVATPAVRRILRQPDHAAELAGLLQEGRDGMMSLAAHANQLLAREVITSDVAQRFLALEVEVDAAAPHSRKGEH